LERVGGGEKKKGGTSLPLGERSVEEGKCGSNFVEDKKNAAGGGYKGKRERKGKNLTVSDPKRIRSSFKSLFHVEERERSKEETNRKERENKRKKKKQSEIRRKKPHRKKKKRGKSPGQETITNA